jgi:hypothetical protein
MVPGGIAGGPLELCREHRFAGRLPPHPLEQPGGRDPCLGRRHAPGEGGADRRLDTPDRGHPPRGRPSFTPVFDGAPQFRPIESTSLQYVANTPDAIIEIDAMSFYALRNGIWFASSSVLGRWIVASFVPDAIYSIPASSPLHYVIYVQIYLGGP